MREVLMYVCEICSDASEDHAKMLAHEEICRIYKEAEDKRKAQRIASGQLTIGQIIAKCKCLPDLPVLIGSEEAAEYNGKSPVSTDSYRGYYNELAIGVDSKLVPLSQFLHEIERSLTRTYYGWKGGEYIMYDDTFVWLAESGETSKTIVTDVRMSASGEAILLCVRELRDEER